MTDETYSPVLALTIGSDIFSDEGWDGYEMHLTVKGAEPGVRYNNGAVLEIGSQRYVIFLCEESAGKGAVRHWADLAGSYPEQFREEFGNDEVLISWGLGQENAREGETPVSSFDAWLTQQSLAPEKTWAYFDGHSLKVTNPSDDLCDALGFVPSVAYRVI